MRTLFRWFQEGRLQPQVTEVYPLENAGTALRRLAERKSAGRIVLAV
jgi:NADPH2:quinone reductase